MINGLRFQEPMDSVLSPLATVNLVSSSMAMVVTWQQFDQQSPGSHPVTPSCSWQIITTSRGERNP